MISQIESNKTSPTLVVLSKLANAMNIIIGDLVEPPNDSIKIEVFEPSADIKVSNANSAFVCHQLRTKTAKYQQTFIFSIFQNMEIQLSQQIFQEQRIKVKSTA